MGGGPTLTHTPGPQNPKKLIRNLSKLIREPFQCVQGTPDMQNPPVPRPFRLLLVGFPKTPDFTFRTRFFSSVKEFSNQTPTILCGRPYYIDRSADQPESSRQKKETIRHQKPLNSTGTRTVYYVAHFIPSDSTHTITTGNPFTSKPRIETSKL